jgi:hypothetical protein
VTKSKKEKNMAFRKKRGEVWYVYWTEKGHKYTRAVSKDLEATQEFQLNLENRLFAKKNGTFQKNVPFQEVVEEYFRMRESSNFAKKTIKREKIMNVQFRKNIQK